MPNDGRCLDALGGGFVSGGGQFVYGDIGDMKHLAIAFLTLSCLSLSAQKRFIGDWVAEGESLIHFLDIRENSNEELLVDYRTVDKYDEGKDDFQDHQVNYYSYKNSGELTVIFYDDRTTAPPYFLILRTRADNKIFGELIADRDVRIPLEFKPLVSSE